MTTILAMMHALDIWAGSAPKWNPTLDKRCYKPDGDLRETWQELVLGVRSRARKAEFICFQVIFGLSDMEVKKLP
jgi:hypothetical protein